MLQLGTRVRYFENHNGKVVDGFKIEISEIFFYVTCGIEKMILRLNFFPRHIKWKLKPSNNCEKSRKVERCARILRDEES
jgi:hypothetical protein